MNDFASYLTEFLSVYLPGQKNASKNTICSYRDTFKLLLRYCENNEGISAEKLSMTLLSNELIVRFLTWLESARKCSISTRNQRLAAIHAFFRYAQYEDPAGLLHFQKIIALPMKKAPKPSIPYLTPDAMKFLLNQPDRTNAKGRRDATLLSLLYDSGCRVQELIDLSAGNFIKGPPSVLVITGKGNKTRHVPLMKNTAALLSAYLDENALDKTWKNEYFIFVNKQNNQLTKEGISYIINKYVVQARKTYLAMPEKVTPHIFRHSKAMHLLQAGINLIYIRDFLGHSDIQTTEIYAKADTELKRRAIENAYPDLVEQSLPDWNRDTSLMGWLSKLK
jgi:site-specific recombinase XerD